MKRLYRDPRNEMIGGVCSGLANYLEVDPTAVRLAFVLMLFVGLGGLWIYLVLWIIMPVATGSSDTIMEGKPKKAPIEPKKVAASSKTSTKSKEPAAKKPAAKATTAKKPTVKRTSKPSAKTSMKTPAAKKPASKPKDQQPPEKE